MCKDQTVFCNLLSNREEMMDKTKKLLNLLSAIAKCPSTSQWSLYTSLSRTRFPYDPTSLFSQGNSSRVLTIFGQNYLGKVGFSGKSFCSESVGEASIRCWSCDAAPKKTPFLFCEACCSIQPVDPSVDYFQIFGLEKEYGINVGSLEGKYKDWQKKLHPDLVHSKSEKEREYAAGQSARVTDAYRTLTKPLSRAIYIMRLDGINVDEEETITDPELLAEIMELREAVEEAADSQALDQIQSQVQEKLKQWSDSFTEAFQTQKFDEAVVCIRRMTYYERANEEIIKKL